MKTLTAMFTKLYNEFEAYFVDMLGLFCLENDMDNAEDNMVEMDNKHIFTVSNKYNFRTYITPIPSMG